MTDANLSNVNKALVHGRPISLTCTAVIRNSLGVEVDRMQCAAACDPLAIYAVNHGVPPSTLREAGWSFEIVASTVATDREAPK